MIATSINNEISVSSENILYINKDEFCDETSEYHKIDCPRFINNDNNENVDRKSVV